MATDRDRNHDSDKDKGRTWRAQQLELALDDSRATPPLRHQTARRLTSSSRGGKAPATTRLCGGVATRPRLSPYHPKGPSLSTVLAGARDPRELRDPQKHPPHAPPANGHQTRPAHRALRGGGTGQSVTLGAF
ncbi:unnamed protein product [Diplocarpon coronariae]